MISSLLKQKRPIVFWIAIKFLLLVGCIAAIQKVLSSSFLERLSGLEFVHPTGMNTSSLDWFIILLFLFFGSTYTSYKESDRSAPSVLQIILSILGVAVFVVAGFIATHPTDAVFTAMVTFIAQERVIGGPLIASYLASMMTLSAIPLFFFFFPFDFIQRYRKKIFFLFCGLEFCLFSTVLEAMYHSFFSEYILRTVVILVRPFFSSVYADPARSILSVQNFLVRVGPACSGLSFLILFISFFFYILFSHSPAVIIRKHRATLVLLAGIIGLFFINALRIASIMMVGTFAPNLAMNLFHSGVGVVLFFIFFLLFLPTMKRWVFQKV